MRDVPTGIGAGQDVSRPYLAFRTHNPNPLVMVEAALWLLPERTGIAANAMPVLMIDSGLRSGRHAALSMICFTLRRSMLSSRAMDRWL